jgi:HEAT repeat protein
MTLNDRAELVGSLNLLRQESSWWRRLSIADRLAALQVVAVHGEPDDISQFFRHVLDRSDVVAQAAAAAVDAIMKRVRATDWAGLYDNLYYLELRPADVDRLRRLVPPATVHILGVATLNRNGYVREAALRELATQAEPGVIPYLLLRLADWVAPVRNLAQELISQFLKARYVRAFLEHRRLLHWLAVVGRVDLGGVREEILSFLRSDLARDEVMAALEEPDNEQRLFCYGLLEEQLEEHPELVERASQDRWAEVRDWVAERLPHLTGAAGDRVLVELLRDRSARVRAAALRAVGDAMWDEVKDRAQILVSDRSPAVRWEARRLLSRHGELDFAAMYREALQEHKVPPLGIVAGLGEVGQAEDVLLIEPFLQHERPSMRAAAFGALLNLEPEPARRRAVELLDDPSGRVRRAAIRVLNRSRGTAHLPAVRRVLRQETGSAQLAALCIIASRHGWETLADILYALLQEDPDLVQQAWQYLVRWPTAVNLWQKLSPDTRDQIQEYRGQIRERTMEVPSFAAHAWQRLDSVIEYAERSL